MEPGSENIQVKARIYNIEPFIICKQSAYCPGEIKTNSVLPKFSKFHNFF